MSEHHSPVPLIYQGLPIEYHAATGLICLTDLWRAQCSPSSQRPLAWVRMEATQRLLGRLAEQMGIEPLYSQRQRPGQEPEQLIVAIPGKLETTEMDGDLRTFATTDLAVVYARYLAPECYEWALANLAEGDYLAQRWAANQSTAELQQRRKAFTRRAVIAAGWTIPVVSALALNQRAAAQVSPGHSDSSQHSDSSHSDTAHNDTSGHSDTPHDDHNDAHSDHNDTPHDDAPHDDHNDVAHNDAPHDDHNDAPHDDHNDVPHNDHSDTPHDDHGDIAHTDSAHGDAAHDDTAHGDEAHTDTAHADTVHGDATHGDTAHGDLHSDFNAIFPTRHGDSHADTPHTDTPHSDAAHADTAHADAHTDTVHGDAAHSDAAHGDAAHTDSGGQIPF